jgi:hypothetical protein
MNRAESPGPVVVGIDGSNAAIGALRRFPDVEVEVATTRLGVTRYLQERIGAVRSIVIGSGDARRVTQLVGGSQWTP